MSALIAVTGGIAAGKTVFTDYCARRYRIPVLDTDRITHHLLQADVAVAGGATAEPPKVSRRWDPFGPNRINGEPAGQLID